MINLCDIILSGGSMSENKGKKPIRFEKKSDETVVKENFSVEAKKPIKISVKENKKINIKKYLIIFLIIFFIISGIYFVNYITIPNIESIKDSVVKVEVYDDELIATGSGFAAYKDNWIVTNYHVIEGASNIKIITDDEKKYNVNKIIIFNKKDDLAILEINGELTPLKLGNGNNIKSKDKITAIGSPMGEKNTISEGIISNADDSDMIRISAPISHGSSGGVLLNSRNKVIGITSAGYDSAQNLNFAINVNILKEMYEKYIDKKYDNITNSYTERCMNLNSDDGGFDYCVGADSDYYSTDTLETFYEITNYNSLYKYKMSNGSWSNVFNNLSSSDIKLASEYYLTLLENDYCSYNCKISSSIDNWKTDEFFINLKILSKEEYAFVVADLKNYKSDDAKFNRVEKYPLLAAQKSLILYLIGDRSWNNIHKDNKQDIFNYFDEKYGTNDFGAILDLLGYDVRYNNDGTLTAWW